MQFTYGEYRTNSARTQKPLTRGEWNSSNFIDNSAYSPHLHARTRSHVPSYSRSNLCTLPANQIGRDGTRTSLPVASRLPSLLVLQRRVRSQLRPAVSTLVPQSLTVTFVQIADEAIQHVANELSNFLDDPLMKQQFLHYLAQDHHVRVRSPLSSLISCCTTTCYVDFI
jgi:hypothetical protein